MQLVYTNENCVGCNKCITACPLMGACISTKPDADGRSRINVDANRCIACGSCFDACVHGARAFFDDTEAFFSDLARGKPISVLIAPAFRANYPEQYERVLGGLKKLGVRHFINISFGADITTWGYIKYIQKHGFTGGISQPCPVVVNYIERYQPDLIPYLFPVQSPLMCAAIYARKEMGITDDFAFISPCIAKKIEITDPATKGAVRYNVTFEHLMSYVQSHGIDGEPCKDEIEYGLGALYPMPGGLTENVRYLMGDSVFIRQIEGEKRLYDFLHKNAPLIKDKKTPFLFIDALNCSNGCLCGTATDSELAHTDTALYNMLSIRESVKKKGGGYKGAWAEDASPKERLAALNEQFSSLNLEDYIRTYTDKSSSCALRTPTEAELEEIFVSMKKLTPESRHIDCSSCGYSTCREMATAIYNGFNFQENCVHFLKDTVVEEEQKIKFQAEHDSLMEIYNRRTIVEKLKELLTDSSVYAIVMVRLNNFKSVNETYGYGQTDTILRQLARKMRAFVEPRGMMVGRHGGAEFLFYVPDVHLEEGSPAMRQIVQIFSEPVALDGEGMLRLSINAGISNSDGTTALEQHILNAETAMSAAKSHQRHAVAVFSQELKAQAEQEGHVRDKLLEAFETDGFFMVYQPKVDVGSKELVGYEALVRMKEPGMYPGQFIPVAEKNGWIWRIGRITTEKTICQLAAWRDAGHELHPVSINYSSNQLSDAGYVDFLESLLAKYQIPSEMVEIEITEGVFLGKSSQADELFRRLKEMNIRLLMDDFGTGYSSLAYLTYVPVDVIKLDKSLVDAYLVEGKDSFIRNMITLVHDLDKEMLIEGVEEKWQFERLREFKADTIQGYYFSKPLPAEEAAAFRVAK